MSKNICNRNYLKLLDYTSDEIRYLLDLAKEFKALKRAGVPHKYLEGKNIVLLFEKTSTRTRCSFEVAGYDLGLGVTFLDPGSSQMGKKESIADTARVLGRIYDGIEYRGFGQELVEELAKYAGVPVWNGLTNEWHPTQMLADLLTIEEHFGHLKGINFTYMGDARYNMGNSLMVACAKMGMNYTACAPKEFWPAADLIKKCEEICKVTGGSVRMEADVKKATTDADVIYTDIWVSMGEPDAVWDERLKLLLPYQVNKEAMANAKKDAIFLHCLPSYHDLRTTVGKEIAEKFGDKYPAIKGGSLEVTDEVFESPQSKVFDEAENRMHTIKAVIYATLH